MVNIIIQNYKIVLKNKTKEIYYIQCKKKIFTSNNNNSCQAISASDNPTLHYTIIIRI